MMAVKFMAQSLFISKIIQIFAWFTYYISMTGFFLSKESDDYTRMNPKVRYYRK